MKQQPRQLQRSKSLTEQAVEEIRARIVRGDFELSAPLSESTLAAELGVSKTPVREALLQLRSEGLVSIQPQRGSFVFDISSAEILELGELRETLELAALRLAAERDARGLADALRAIMAKMRLALDRGDVMSYRMLDGDFHRAFFEHAGNRYLLASYLGIAFRIQALRTRLSKNPVLNRSSYRDHESLHQLIRAGRTDEALALLSSHVRGTIVDYAASIDVRRAAEAS